MTQRILVGFTLLMGLAITSCKDLPRTCGVPGESQACDCTDGRTNGTQTCRDKVWTECACTGPIPDGGAGTGDTDGGDSGTGGTGGDSGTGGTGGDSGTGGDGGTGGTGGDSGTGGTGGDSGTGGTGGDSGTGGTGGSFPAAYMGPCTENADCGPGALCLKNAGMTKSHCSPECSDTTTCPAPPTGGAPLVECSAVSLGGPTSCRLACNFLGVTCPTSMTCEPPGLGGYCF